MQDLSTSLFPSDSEVLSDEQLVAVLEPKAALPPTVKLTPLHLQHQSATRFSTFAPEPFLVRDLIQIRLETSQWPISDPKSVCRVRPKERTRVASALLYRSACLLQCTPFLMFHGWRIVAVSALGQAVSAGATFYTFGVLLKPLAADFDATRLVTTLGLTLLMLVQGVISPFVGRALDRYSVRGIMELGVAMLSLGFLLLSQASALWQVALLFGTLIAVGSHLFGPLAAATLVAHWFVRTRGRALGATSLGAMLGGLSFPPLVAFWVEAYDWRTAALALSGVVLLLLIPVWLLVVNRPEDVGLHPDGGTAGETSGSDATPEVTTGSLLRSRNLWVITASIGLAWAPVTVLLAHLVPYATDLGFSPARAASLMSVYAFASGFGRVGVGAASDRMDKRLALGLVVAVLALGWCGMLGEPSFARLLLACGVMGFAVGGVMPLWGALTGACFGREAFGRAMGFMNLPMLSFNLAGAPIAAYLYDRSGSYAGALALFLIPLLTAAVLVSFLRIPRVEPGTGAT